MAKRKSDGDGTGWCVILLLFGFLAMIAFAFLSSRSNNLSTQQFQQSEQEQENVQEQESVQEQERAQVQTLRVRKGQPIPPTGEILTLSEFRNRSNKGVLIDQNGVSYGIECRNANNPELADPTIGMKYRSNGDGTFTPVN